MTCRRCREVYDAAEYRACPKCGSPSPRLKPVFLKTSTILISASDAEGVYRSLDEVPAPLRSRLLESTNGQNSATILIADRKGREEIARAAASRKAASADAAAPGLLARAGSYTQTSAAIRIAAAVLVLLLVTLVLWAVCARSWS